MLHGYWCYTWLHFCSLLALFCGRVLGGECPNTCNCYFNFGPFETVTVDCHGRDLVSIPSPLPASTTHLDLSNNLIQTVSSMNFGPEAADLIHLQLQNNDLQSIEPGAFEFLPSLETLFLYNNYQLTELNGTFVGLSKLRKLVAYNIGLQSISPDILEPLQSISEIDLNFNQLRKIPMDAFSNLHRLKDLSLSNNFITMLEPGSFRNLSSLYYLSLRFNQIRSIPDQAFEDLGKLRSLDLTGNPIQCTCSALFLRQFLLSQQLGGPLCDGPEEFRRKYLLDLGTEEFCDPPAATIADQVPILVLLNSSDFQLSCSATGTPPPNVTWSRDGQILESDGTHVTIVGGSLSISMATITDSGIYHCSASSSAGVASSSQQVLVLAPPTDSAIKSVVQEDAVLECGDELLPPATPTTWFFNGSRLAVASEAYVVLQNGSLLVRRVGLSDMGDYICEVGGQVNFTIGLTVTARPEIVLITEGPCEERLVVRVDSIDALAIRCDAFGIPPPTVTWTLNGDTVLATAMPEVNMSGGVVQLDHDLGRLREGGNYTCTANNSVGSTSTTITVIVRSIDIARGNMSSTSLTRFAGDTVVMNCPVQLTFEEGSVTTWKKRDGTPIPFNSRANLTCDNRTLILREAVRIFDAATYECRIQEPSGRQYFGSVSLLVNERAVIEKVCGVEVVVGTVGGMAQLPCQSRGSTNFDRVWMQGNETVMANVRISISNAGLLRISSLELSDSGIYTCTVSEIDVGQVRELATDSYMIQLVVQMPPEFLTTPSNISVAEGGSVQLPCSGAGEPSPSITWWRSVGEAASPQQIITDGQYYVTGHFLLIPEVFQARDEGTYYCNLTSVAGSLNSDSVFVNVLTPPTLHGEDRSKYILKAGDTNAFLTCSGSGDPQPEVSWVRLKDMIQLPSDNLTNYVINDTSLVILNVSRDDSGSYRCQLINSVGQVFFDVQVEVKALPVTSVVPDSVRANVGCQVTFICMDDGRIPSEFQWSFNGDELMPASDVIIRANGELVLSDLIVEDTGNYSCTIRGSLGDTTATAILSVQDPLLLPGSPGFPPAIFSPTPPLQMLAVHQLVQFVCLVEGFPSPQVRWLKDGEPLPNYRRLVNLNESLRIRDLRKTDSGIYQCQASNSLGMAEREFELNVGVPPYIAKHPLPQVVEAGGEVIMACTATGHPFPNLTWFFNDTEIEEDEHYFITEDSTYLIVRNVSVERDSGVFRCRAENFAGVAYHSSHVTVVELTRMPAITLDPSRNIIAEAGEDLTMDCLASGVPEPSVEWLYNGQPLLKCPEMEEGDNLTSICAMDNVIMIPDMRSAYEGTYSCYANNSVGFASYEINLRLAPEPRSPPVFLVSPQPLWVANESEFTLNCIAIGSPAPTISWELNKLPINMSAIGAVQHPNGSLTIPQANPSTVGFFTCVADNGVNVGESTAQVDILFPESGAPIGTNFPRSRQALLPGQSIVLNCTASGNPQPSVSWTRNGSPIDFVSLPTIRLANNGSLIFTAVTGHEEGNYSCKAVNEGGISEMAFFLEVEDGIITGTGSVVLPEKLSELSGSSLHINCTLPTPAAAKDQMFLWRHKDKVLCGGNNGSSGSLLLSPILMEHAGDYKCQVVSDKGLMENSLTLNVIPKREPPYFLVEPHSTHVVKRGFAILPCLAASPGGEVTHLQWFHDHTPLAGQGVKHLVLKNGSLMLSNLYPAQAGNYSCQASNKYGRSLTSATLTVSKFEVDRFVSAREGSSLALSCEVGEGEEVKWVKDNRNSVPSYAGTLWFSEVDQSHAGEYTCSLNKTSFNYFISIQVPPKITSPSRTMVMLPGGMASLDCMATGEPRPSLSWYHSGHQIERDQRQSVLANGTLLVYRVERKDGGSYTCRATNPQGSVENRLLLLVNG